MDWLLAAPQINSTFSSLGSMIGDMYVVSPNALDVLEEINCKLLYEDQTLRTFRRAIGFGQNVRSDLIPLLENAKDTDVLDSAIRILVNLTVPVECLFSVDIMYRTEVGRHTISELNKLLYTSKEAFTDPKSTKSIMEYMKHILESDSKLSPQKCEKINNCLLLLRNILHIPETSVGFIVQAGHVQNNGEPPVSMQNAILWNLFIQSLDKLLIYLMTSPQRSSWGVSMVQLIALMYKDQHLSTLQKLLNMWFEASLSESSEDNESNTSPPKQGSDDSSPMLTSDPTSDSSDNGGGGRKSETAEDRRQALREETEATLQEVSRKGHEYQNSILRAPPPSHSGNQRRPIAEQAAIVRSEEPTSLAAGITGETMDRGSVGDGERQPVIMHRDNTDAAQRNEYERPNEKGDLPPDTKSDEVFMPPPSVHLKLAPSMASTAQNLSEYAFKEARIKCSETLPKPVQKVPHGGQLSLCKGKSCPQKRQCPSSQSDLSDCGYATQVENQESISTSSNEDDGPQSKPQHQKPPCNSKPRNKQRVLLAVVDKKELRRKKLVKRSKSSLINMKGLVQHLPTDEDISNLLKEFTVDFLLKGYGSLVENLHSQLLNNIKIAIDTSHFFWLVTYFLKFAAQLELDLEHLHFILNFDIISYLTYEGVSLCEQLDLNSRQEGSDLKPYLRRIHLVVTAIREFLQTIETYKKVTHLSEEDRQRLQRLQIQIGSTEDLRCLFVLLLRSFNPGLQTKQYLQDLIVTNHILLLALDNVNKMDGNVNMKMMDHISQFASSEVMYHYGILLEEFSSNGQFINDCIFTMMHHIGGDLDHIGCLFQAHILKVYSRIWEADYELCDDWSDLIEYVINKFMNITQKNSLTLPATSLTQLTKEHNLENTVCKWTQEEMDTLYWYYVQSKKTNDLVGKIVKLFSNNGNKQKSRISIIQQLLQQDIITLVEYDDLMKFEDAEYQRTLLTTPTSTTTESGIELKDSYNCCKPTEDIQILLNLNIKEKGEKHMIWLQKLLLECCYVKLVLREKHSRKEQQELQYVMEPVAYHCILQNKSIPIVQWNNEQASVMTYQPFVLLLHKLGFQLPADAGSVYARIPDFWSPEMMFSLCRKLGPVDKLLLKFNLSQLNMTEVADGCPHMATARASLSSVSSLEMDAVETEETSAKETASAAVEHKGDVCVEKVALVSDKFAIPQAKHSHMILRYPPVAPQPPSLPNWLQLVMRSKCGVTTNESSRSIGDVTMSSNTGGPACAFTSGATKATRSAASTAAAVGAIGGQLQSATAAVANVIGPCNSSINESEVGDVPECSSPGGGGGSGSSKAAGDLAPATLLRHSLLDDDNANPMKSFDGCESAYDRYDRYDSSSSGFHTRSGSGNLDSEYSAMIAEVYESEIANSEHTSIVSDLTRMYVSDEEEKQDFHVENFN